MIKKPPKKQCDLIKLKSFCIAKGTIKKKQKQKQKQKQKKKPQSTEWKKTVANNATDKGPIFKTCKQLIQPKKPSNPVKKRSGNLNRNFSQDIEMANTHMKTCST